MGRGGAGSALQAKACPTKLFSWRRAGAEPRPTLIVRLCIMPICVYRVDIRKVRTVANGNSRSRPFNNGKSRGFKRWRSSSSLRLYAEFFIRDGQIGVRSNVTA